MFLPIRLGRRESHTQHGSKWELSVNPIRIGGIVLLVVGVVMLIYGVNAAHSLADKLSQTWSGRVTERTTWYIIGGIGIGLAGVLMAAFGGRGKNA